MLSRKSFPLFARTLWTALLVYGFSAAAIATANSELCATAIAPREETVTTFVALGAESAWLQTAWATVPPKEMPTRLREWVNHQEWPVAESDRIYALLYSLGESYGWTPDQIEATATFVMEQSFGTMSADSWIVAERAFDEDGGSRRGGGFSPDSNTSENCDQIERLFAHLEETYGRIPPVRDLKAKDLAVFHSIPFGARVWVTREVRKRMGETRADYVRRAFLQKLTAVDFARILLTESGLPLENYRGWRGLVKLGRLIGAPGASRVYEIARYVLTAEQLRQLEWVLFPAYVETTMLAQLHRELVDDEGKPRARYREMMGLAALADVYTRKRADLAYQMASFVLTTEQREAMGWTKPSRNRTANQLRLAVEQARTPAAFYDVAGWIRAAVILDSSLNIGRKAVAPGGSESPALSPGEAWLLLQTLPEDRQPVARYVGPAGLDRMAQDYFEGHVYRAFTALRALRGRDAMRELGWSESRRSIAFLTEPFQGPVIPPRILGLVARDPLVLTPEQRWAAKQHLLRWLDTGVAPSQADWNNHFAGSNEAIRIIQHVGEDHGFAIDWLATPLTEPPVEIVREILQSAAVNRYLQWTLDRDGHSGEVGREWPGDGRGVAVPTERIFGEGPYASDRRDYRVFDDRAQAIRAIRRRALELRLEIGEPRFVGRRRIE